MNKMLFTSMLCLIAACACSESNSASPNSGGSSGSGNTGGGATGGAGGSGNTGGSGATGGSAGTGLALTGAGTGDLVADFGVPLCSMNGWHHFAIVVDATAATATWYHDGAPVSTVRFARFIAGRR